MIEQQIYRNDESGYRLLACGKAFETASVSFEMARRARMPAGKPACKRFRLSDGGTALVMNREKISHQLYFSEAENKTALEDYPLQPEIFRVEYTGHAEGAVLPAINAYAFREINGITMACAAARRLFEDSEQLIGDFLNALVGLLRSDCKYRGIYVHTREMKVEDVYRTMEMLLRIYPSALASCVGYVSLPPTSNREDGPVFFSDEAPGMNVLGMAIVDVARKEVTLPGGAKTTDYSQNRVIAGKIMEGYGHRQLSARKILLDMDIFSVEGKIYPGYLNVPIPETVAPKEAEPIEEPIKTTHEEADPYDDPSMDVVAPKQPAPEVKPVPMPTREERKRASYEERRLETNLEALAAMSPKKLAEYWRDTFTDFLPIPSSVRLHRLINSFCGIEHLLEKIAKKPRYRLTLQRSALCIIDLCMDDWILNLDDANVSETLLRILPTVDCEAFGAERGSGWYARRNILFSLALLAHSPQDEQLPTAIRETLFRDLQSCSMSTILNIQKTLFDCMLTYIKRERLMEDGIEDPNEQKAVLDRVVLMGVFAECLNTLDGLRWMIDSVKGDVYVSRNDEVQKALRKQRLYRRYCELLTERVVAAEGSD